MKKSGGGNGNGASGNGGEGVRCAIYTRKSTARGLEQEFNSLDAQREACEQYIALKSAMGWRPLPDRYDDGGFTGANLERPAFQKLLEDIEAGKIDVVVVYKVDRLSRSLLDFARVMERFSNFSAAFVSVTQNFSTADAIGRLTLNMLMSFAEFERSMISERTKDKLAAARKRGKWTGGIVPLGYQAVNKKLVIDELESVTIREIFDLYEKHRSALFVAGELNRLGRRTKRYQAENGRLKTAHRWSKNAVLRILKNPLYAGLIAYEGETYEGEHEAIIERERFEVAQHLLRDHAASSMARGRNPDYILRGLLRCVPCGRALTPASTRRRGKEYRYYRCVTQEKYGKDLCPSRPLPAAAIEEFVIERVRSVAADERLVGELLKKLRRRIAERRKPLVAERAALPSSIAEMEEKAREMLETLPGAKETMRRMIEERIDEVERDMQRQEARLREVERLLAELDLVEMDAGWVSEILSNFDRVWSALNLENRGRLVRAVIRRVEVNEPEGTISAVVADLGLDEIAEPAGSKNGKASKDEAPPADERAEAS